MRDIKFRAIPNKDFMINENQKNILNSIAYYTKGEFYDDTFIYGYLADGYIIGKTIEAGEEYFVPSYWVPVEKETIGQYTGFKDNNGVEIYEGDKLLLTITYQEFNGREVVESALGVVEWYEDGWIVDVKEGYCDNEDLIDWVEGDVEVIGNIHETPKKVKE